MATACELAGSRLQATPVDQFQCPHSSWQERQSEEARAPTGSFTSATASKLSALANGKLFANPHKQPGGIELYDLDADIGESKNLAGQFP